MVNACAFPTQPEIQKRVCVNATTGSKMLTTHVELHVVFWGLVAMKIPVNVYADLGRHWE